MKGEHSIIVTGLKIKLIKFISGLNENYRYVINGNEIFGAGSIRPSEFYIVLSGNDIGRALWNVKNSGASISKSDNFFDIHNPQYLSLDARTDDFEEVLGTVLFYVIKQAYTRWLLNFITVLQERII